jgi:NAD(P)-dependent dehydrogenase (short-subunit alcohol dehydrogenase family)
MTKKLEGKTAVITGGTEGIGLAGFEAKLRELQERVGEMSTKGARVANGADR